MTNIDDYSSSLDSIAKKEFDRIWNMRSDMAGINEASLPILMQYCTIYSQVQKLSQSMVTLECDEKEWDKKLARLDKLNKMLLSFVKVLKLCDGGSSDSKNKFAKLLLK